MTIGRGVIGLGAASVLVSLAGTASAQCADWRARPGLHLTGIVRCVGNWDPDGAGPKQPLMVVGGDFDRAGGISGAAATNIAAYDSVTSTWQALGSGITGITVIGVDVHALAEYQGELVAGGAFTNAGGLNVNNIARWDGVSWKSLGSGVFIGSGFSPYVAALTTFNNELVAGGHFVVAGDLTANGIARWNGSEWKPFSTGMGGPFPQVNGVAVYNGQLHAAGVFTSAGGVPCNNVARWNGTAWQPLGTGVGNQVYTLCTHGNLLIAGGSFGSPSSDIAAWNGSSWMGLDNGVDGSVYAAASYAGDLYACGFMTEAGTNNVPVKFITKWNGTNWSTLGNPAGSHGLDAWAGALGVHKGELVVGGYFNTAGGNSVDALARWNGTNWLDIAGVVSEPQGSVRALAPWAGRMVLGGDFATEGTPPGTGNDADAVQRLAGWAGTTIFEQYGGTSWTNDVVRALKVTPGPLFSTNLVVGGNFTDIAGVPANRIASFNDLVAGTTTFGAGFANGEVLAIERHNNELYAGGTFTSSGATTVNRVARWNGSAWSALGVGMSSGSVNALRSFGGLLYAGGSFTNAGGVSTGGLARWNGSSWSQVGGFFNGSIDALVIYQGKLAIGGLFPGINSSPNLAGYDGAVYFTYGVGGTDARVRALTVSSGGADLIVGGDFIAAGGLAAKRVARWNGAAWSEVGGGADGPVHALSTFQNEIHAGGTFDNVRNSVLHTPKWARFSEDGIPWFVTHPKTQGVDCGQTAAFSVEVAQGYGGLSFEWRKDGVPLVAGGGNCGSTIAISGTKLAILGVTEDDAGSYDCVVTNGCGSKASVAAVLSVNGTCPGNSCYADCDCDGALSIDDFICYQTLFALADPYADCDGDSVLSIDDFICFQTMVAIGC